MMLPMTDSVSAAQKGSITTVVGSGMTSMSEALIGCQPRIELPSKPLPSSKIFSSNSLIGMVKCCQVPRKSRNLKSTQTALFSFANLTASLGVILRSPFLPCRACRFVVGTRAARGRSLRGRGSARTPPGPLPGRIADSGSTPRCSRAVTRLFFPSLFRRG